MPEKRKRKLTRAEQSALTKDRIIQTGLALLKEEGYENLTVRNICERAEISTGSFYHFYKTKDDLMSEFLHRTEWEDDMENADDIVEYIIHGYVSLIDVYETLGMNFVSSYYTATNQSFNVYTREVGGYVSDYIRKHLMTARDQGYIRDDVSIDKIIYGVQTLVIGNVFQWCVVKGATDIRMDLDRMLRDYLTLRIVSEKYKEIYLKA